MRANDTVLVNTLIENEFISVFISIYIYLVSLFQLSNLTRKFSSDSDYSFFAHSVIQKVKLNNQINISMIKVASDLLTADMLSSNLNGKVKKFIAIDQTFTFRNCIK